MARMFDPEAQERVSLLVHWHGDHRCTEVLICHPDKTVDLLGRMDGDTAQRFVAGLRQDYPRLRIDVRPGAYGRNTITHED